MKQILTLDDLAQAVEDQRAVTTKTYNHHFGWRQYTSAAWIYNQNASRVHYLIKLGLFIYEPKKKKPLCKTQTNQAKPKSSTSKPSTESQTPLTKTSAPL